MTIHTYAALLRGINVGGRNTIPMKALTALFEAEGCIDVETYIQSGNVVFRASKQMARSIPTRITAAIEKTFSLNVPVVLRTADDLARIEVANPFLKGGAEPKTLHVAFLAKTPSASRVAALDPERSPPDAFSIHGADIYLYYPNGSARSKLNTAYFDKQLADVTTVRNWNTLLRLVAMTARESDPL